MSSYLDKTGLTYFWSKIKAAISDKMTKGVDYVTAGKKAGTNIGDYATAEGSEVTANGGFAHAEGYGTTASKSCAHAEGNRTSATAASAHSEGRNSVADADAAHAEGYGTTAYSSYSHAEGYLSYANGHAAHAEGYGTRANGKGQHVVGEYNVADNGSGSTRGTYVEIVGNGTGDSARSNARTLDWNGNETLAGKLTLGAGPTNNMDAATKQYVDEHGGAGINYGNTDLEAGVSPLAEGTFYAYYI